jgi:two-component system sensor histidine kinase GlrK
MKVASKVATGAGITIVLLLAVLAYDLSLVRRLATANQDLTKITFRASMIALQQARLLNLIDEFTRKHFVTQDPAYARRLEELGRAFSKRLADLSSLGLSEGERAEVARLSLLWSQFKTATIPAAAGPEESERRQDPDSQARVEAQVLGRVSALQQQVGRVGRAAQLAVSREAARSEEASRRANRVSWTVVALALVLSVTILWLTIRSISEPLRRLTEGTRAVAGGRFSYQLDESGNDEFSALASSFNQMVHRLAELDGMKKDFLSHVSHELKTPLASMQETNELLLEEIPGRLNEKQKRFLGLNLDSGQRLSSMIAKLLDLSRMEAGVLEYELRSHDLKDVVRTALGGFEVRSQEREVEIRCCQSDTPLLVRCDRDRVIQVVENLVDNALKFSPRPGTIEVKVATWSDVRQAAPASRLVQALEAEMVQDRALVQVLDQGPGIPDDQKDRIFEKFYQVGKPRQETGGRGVGLGLAICREIVEAHEGVVGVTDNEEAGSCFYFTMPLQATAEDSSGRAPTAGDSPADTAV